MPEYLSPGVYIEELPPRLRAIEGVSTSTAGMVGPADRGPVPGFPLPFTPDKGFVLPRDPALVLVTSFAEFTRQFGNPLPIPAPGDSVDHGYLAYAVRAFFANGGKRAYISRIVHLANPPDASSATRSSVRLGQGVVLRLLRSAHVGDTELALTSLRGLDVGDTLSFLRRSDGTPIASVVPTVSSYNTQRNTITLNAPLTADMDPSEVYILPAGTTPTADGPMFFARNPGSWSEDISITVNQSDRSPVPITAAAAGTATAVQVQSTRSFYLGAIVEIDHGTTRSRHEVQGIVGTSLQLSGTLGAAVTTGGFARVLEIDVIIDDASGASPSEAYKGVSWNQGTNANMQRHYAAQINAQSRLVYVQPPGVGTPALAPAGSEDNTLATQPTTINGFPQRMTTVGNDGLPAAGTAGDPDYVGDDPGPGQRTGIEALKDADSISIIAAPGKTTPTVQAALIEQCELLRYRFAVLDGEAEPLGGSVTSILAHRSIFDSSYAAYYTPWIEVTNGNQTIHLPPSGYVAGIYARTDNDRGVWKAPANEVVLTATGLKFYFTTGEQDVLNPVGVNCIRLLTNTGIRVWGARTLSSDPAVKYVNVRRTLIFLEASIDRGTQWVVFEPNSPDTWDRLTDSVSAFLTTQWREGALFGLKPENAFFVRCDETTMTADDIQNGRLICEIGVSIVRPAEFVIFRIEQITDFGNQ